jgi:hypothetical protein
MEVAEVVFLSEAKQMRRFWPPTSLRIHKTLRIIPAMALGCPTTFGSMRKSLIWQNDLAPRDKD